MDERDYQFMNDELNQINMSKKRKVISFSNLPTRPPILATVVYVTALKVYEAPEWLWGAFGLFLFLGWVSAIYDFSTQEKTDIFKDDK